MSVMVRENSYFQNLMLPKNEINTGINSSKNKSFNSKELKPCMPETNKNHFYAYNSLLFKGKTSKDSEFSNSDKIQIDKLLRPDNNSVAKKVSQEILKNKGVKLSKDELTSEAVRNGEGTLSKDGVLVVNTGKYNGRSPNDRFFVDTPLVHDKINWGKNCLKISPAQFDHIYDKVKNYLETKDKLYVFDGFAGADPRLRMPVKFINELASHNLSEQNMFIHPDSKEKENFIPGFTVIAAPGLKLDPKEDGVNSEAGILINLEKGVALITGTQYAGEIKKSIFTAMSFLLPVKNAFPMHCSANVGDNGDVALFYGLSGTGKTTLSACPNRSLIGDDEHIWSEKGISNLEGGCYAKLIGLDKKNEPQIWNAVHQKGALIENVPFDQDRELDFEDCTVENTRGSYPLSSIDNAKIPSYVNSHPKNIVFLTYDASGVIPPVSKLTPEQAEYYFINGYTSKVAGTERGITEPQSTFSACFGEPFMPLHPIKYANMLANKVEQNNSSVFLINTGLIGKPEFNEKGKPLNRIDIPSTRAIVDAVMAGQIKDEDCRIDPVFKFMVPNSVEGVKPELLNPEELWENKDDYKKAANGLAQKFQNNFKKYLDEDNKLSTEDRKQMEELVAAGPRES